MQDLLKNSLPFWNSLTDDEQQLLIQNLTVHKYEKGTILYHGGSECTGVEIIQKGRARVYINSKDGKEITINRILENDVCIMSAACMIKNINFGMSLETETDCEIALIPRKVYQQLNDNNMFVKNFTLELVAEKLSDVMYLLEQFVFSNMGQRLANELLEQAVLAGSLTIDMTHEKIALDLGSAREVITRLLKQFQIDGLVSLSRGKIEITNETALRKMGE